MVTSRPHDGKVDRARPRLGEPDEIPYARHTQARTHDEHERPAHEERYGGEIGERVVGEIPEQVRIGGVAVEHREQRVAVGRRLDRGRRAQGSACPWAVLDEKLLAERLAELRRDQARADVREAARRVRHDDPDGLARIRRGGNLGETRRC